MNYKLIPIQLMSSPPQLSARTVGHWYAVDDVNHQFQGYEGASKQYRRQTADNGWVIFELNSELQGSISPVHDHFPNISKNYRIATLESGQSGWMSLQGDLLTLGIKDCVVVRPKQRQIMYLTPNSDHEKSGYHAWSVTGSAMVEIELTCSLTKADGQAIQTGQCLHSVIWLDISDQTEDQSLLTMIQALPTYDAWNQVTGLGDCLKSFEPLTSIAGNQSK